MGRRGEQPVYERDRKPGPDVGRYPVRQARVYRQRAGQRDDQDDEREDPVGPSSHGPGVGRHREQQDQREQRDGGHHGAAILSSPGSSREPRVD